MPITLSELKQKTATVDVYKYAQREGFEAGDVNVTYRILSDVQDRELEKRMLVFQARANILDKNGASVGETEDIYDEAQELQDEAIKFAIDRQLISWDILGDDSEPLPLTYETIQAHPMLRDVVTDTMRAIRAQASPPNPNGQQSQRR